MSRSVVAVLEGGGVRGISLAGALAAALDSGHEIARVVGTSAGALVGSLVAAGYGSSELRGLVERISWPDLLDPDPLTRIPGLGRHLAMVRHRGVYRGRELERTWRRLLGDVGVRTFRDLPNRLRVIATDISHTRGVVLPDDLASLGLDPATFPVAAAVRASASVPFFFQPFVIGDGRHETVLVDGAMAENFPVHVVDASAGLPVLGFRFVTPSGEDRHRAVRSPLRFVSAVIASSIRARDAFGAHLPDVTTIVDVPATREPLDFHVDSRQARLMFERGYDAAATQLGGHPVQ